jgi:ferredoxin-NADP reductase
MHSDGVRSWTISRWQTTDASMAEMDITMRVKPNGAITPMLFAFGAAVNERGGGRFEGQLAISFPLHGIAGSFIPSSASEQLWLAQGIGLTPFLAFLRQPTASKAHLAVTLRLADVPAFEQLISDALAAGPSNNVKVSFFISNADEEAVAAFPTKALASTRYPGRLTAAHLSDSSLFGGLQQREIFLCGTDAFRASVVQALEGQMVDAGRIHYESFSF